MKWPFDIFRRQAAYPEWYQRYAAQNFNPPKETLIDELSFVVFDTETTGLDPSKDEILSIGAIKLQGQRFSVGQVFHFLNHSEHSKFSEDSVQIHGLRASDLPSHGIEELIPIFFEYVGNAILVGHHIGFDVKMIELHSKKIGGGPLLNKCLDTATLARRYDDPWGTSNVLPDQYTLDTLCQRFDEKPLGRHTAEGDAYLTTMVFLKICALLKIRGILKYKDL